MSPHNGDKDTASQAAAAAATRDQAVVIKERADGVKTARLCIKSSGSWTQVG